MSLILIDPQMELRTGNGLIRNDFSHEKSNTGSIPVRRHLVKRIGLKINFIKNFKRKMDIR